jgi:predicted dinucleotide-binding enzyme
MFIRVLIVLLLIAIGGPATADTIAIIGTGQVGQALGAEFAAQGHRVVYGSRDPSIRAVTDLVARTGNDASAVSPAAAAKDADIVVLAIPGLLVEEITRGLGDLSGRIIIDPTNPLVFEDGRVTHGVETSNAEIIQAAAPGAHVVKAFNTLNWRTMISPEESGGPVTIPLVGDDAAAKRTVAELVEGMGLEAIDLGPLDQARWVEGMLIVRINYGRGSNQSFDYHLRRNERQ